MRRYRTAQLRPLPPYKTLVILFPPIASIMVSVHATKNTTYKGNDTQNFASQPSQETIDATRASPHSIKKFTEFRQISSLPRIKK